jgi:hypothetical protein
MQERALYLLTAAGMIGRRATFRLRMFGHPVAVEATITVTGEGGLGEAIKHVAAGTFDDWREIFEKRKASGPRDAPTFHCERIGKEQWRLTAEGVDARHDLDAGRQSTVIDFVLQRGFFDGHPRLMPDGRISQRVPVAGTGSLERMQRVRSDADPAGVNVANWAEGAQAFKAVFAELVRTRGPIETTPAKPADHPSIALLRVYTNGLSDDRIKEASRLLTDDTLTANEKLTKIDALIRFPATASAEQLGTLLDVSKQAVLKTDWWMQNRRGEKDSEIGRRRDGHRKRAKGYDSPGPDPDDE